MTVLQPIISLFMAAILFLIFSSGCSEPSEWDAQWETIQQSIRGGNLSHAKTQLQDILPSIREYGPSDTRYAQIIYQLGDIARLEGDLTQAESYYWKALPLIVQSLGPEHVRMADPLTELATIYEQKAQPKVAIPLLKRALAIREKSWGVSSRHLLPTLKHYHLLLMLNDQHDVAGHILERISTLEQTPS
ncbi:MAG: tetratricopeptide repeat protein [Nitrospirota bacterium]|nr:tetratricopeptide repeat protein [Nitrospirota bacterium]